MKHSIKINLSKDTPIETVKALQEVLKIDKQQKGKQLKLYLLNEDIEKLNARYEELFKQVKNSSNLSEKQIEKECDILSQKYDFEIEELSKQREVDYQIRLAKVKARAEELRPLRQRHWYWLFRTFPNRAQDIIDEREHSAAEKQLDNEWEQLFPEKEKRAKRELKRKLKKQVKETIKKADAASTNEVFEEPSSVPSDVQALKEDNERAAAPFDVHELPTPRIEVATAQEQSGKAVKQLPGQMTLDYVQAQEDAGQPAQAQPQTRPVQNVWNGKPPRPPRSCRRQ